MSETTNPWELVTRRLRPIDEGRILRFLVQNPELLHALQERYEMSERALTDDKRVVEAIAAINELEGEIPPFSEPTIRKAWLKVMKCLLLVEMPEPIRDELRAIVRENESD